MSWVANLLVCCGFSDEGRIQEFSDWLEHDAPWNEPPVPPNVTGVGFLRPLTSGDHGWGGWKNPECVVWAGALNHAELSALTERFGQIDWEEPGCAQLLVMDQEQSYFRLWMIREGRLQQFGPPPDEERGGY